MLFGSNILGRPILVAVHVYYHLHILSWSSVTVMRFTSVHVVFCQIYEDHSLQNWITTDAFASIVWLPRPYTVVALMAIVRFTKINKEKLRVSCQDFVLARFNSSNNPSYLMFESVIIETSVHNNLRCGNRLQCCHS